MSSLALSKTAFMSTLEKARGPPTNDSGRSRDRKRDRDKDKDRGKGGRSSQGGGGGGGGGGQKAAERLKTVVRRLPPNLPEEVFWKSVEQWVTDDTATWKEYYQGKFRKRCVHCGVWLCDRLIR